MSKNNENLTNYCVYCGAKIKKEQIYCPKCGKLVVKIKSEKDVSQSYQVSKPHPAVVHKEITRKCSGCGSLITSTVLDQCPICNTMLEPIPEAQKTLPAKTGFIFTENKLEPEQNLIIKKDTWNLKEGLNVFTNSILVYITVQIFLVGFLYYQGGFGDSEQYNFSQIDIFLIILSQIPGILLGIFPLWYIVSNKHDFEKLGFPTKDKKLFLAFIIGILGASGLIAINYFSSFITSFLFEIGLDFFEIQKYMEIESKAIKAGGYWVIILLIELILTAISVEIVFRGVLHNTLREKFGFENNNGKIITIMLVALIYSAIYLLFSFPLGLYFLIPNFLVFLLLGFLYEINRNIYNTIIASIFYNISLIIIILYF
ncbi:MAG: type II CAAX prenyl endopeptidase Rce1 family protein [Candidatus Hermodarchaeota archaeon]